MAIWNIKEMNAKVRGNEIRGQRALFGGGEPAAAFLDYITISTLGDGTDFGTLTATTLRKFMLSSRCTHQRVQKIRQSTDLLRDLYLL